ncbi:MAG: ATP-binding protein [Leptolyngbya sp. BL-A-14]
MHCRQVFPYGIDQAIDTSQAHAPQTEKTHWRRLADITDQLQATRNEAAALQVVVKELGMMPTIIHCAAILFDGHQEKWITRYNDAAPEASEHHLVQSIHLLLETKNWMSVQRPFLLCHLDRETHLPTQPLEILISPIVADASLQTTGQTIAGIFWLAKVTSHESSFHETEIQLVEQATTQCAIALQKCHLSQAIQSQLDQVEKLNQLKEDFLNTTTHELRTPLANMKLGLKMLELVLNDEDQAKQRPVKASCYLKLVQDACEQEIQLINDLLVLQQLEAGNYPILLNAIALQGWLSEIIQVFELKALAQNQRLRLTLFDDLPRLVCDLVLLDRVMRELLTNACKFTPAGGEIVVTAQAIQGAIRISVTNSGVELPETELERVFDKFYRMPTNDPWRHSGVGLGLALIKGLVTHLGGSIQVASTNNHVCFAVELPTVQPEIDSTERDRLMSYVAYYLSRGKTIMSPTQGALAFAGVVYDYWGYHQDFLTFWQQLQQRKDFGSLYLEKDTFAFSQFLCGEYTVSQCARCRLPIPSPTGKAYTTPSCALCDDQLLCKAIASADASNASVQATTTHVMAIGRLPSAAEELQQWFQVNRFEVSFIAHPEEITFDTLPETVELILLVEELSEAQAKTWVQTLRCYAQLCHAPIIALSAQAGCGQIWMDGILSLEDYLITPLSGDHLAHHLNRLARTSQQMSEPYWFPLYG